MSPISPLTATGKAEPMTTTAHAHEHDTNGDRYRCPLPACWWNAYRRDRALTCEYCDCAPATHLLVADLAKPAGSRAADLVCGACGEAGVRDAAQISASRSSVWLFTLIPAGKDVR